MEINGPEKARHVTTPADNLQTNVEKSINDGIGEGSPKEMGRGAPTEETERGAAMEEVEGLHG